MLTFEGPIMKKFLKAFDAILVNLGIWLSCFSYGLR